MIAERGHDFMGQIQLIATYLDGTFLMCEDTPHPENVKMVEKCHAHGIRVCACSGRPWPAIEKIALEAGLDDFCVTNNGASVVNIHTGEIRYRNRFDEVSMRKLIEVGLSLHCESVHVAGHKGMHVYNMDGSIETEKPSFMGMEEWNSFHFYPTLEQMLQAAADDAERVIFGRPQAHGFQEIYDRCNPITPVEVTSTETLYFVEITPAYGTKAEAIAVLAGIYDCKPENVLALGDGFNDLHMLLWAGTGVAMGNADARLKAVADMTTDTNRNAGFAKAVERIVFAGK